MVAVAQTSDPNLMRWGEEFIQRWVERRPHLAMRFGLQEYDLLPVTQASLERDGDWYRRFRERLRAVPRNELSFDAALDYDLLLARTEHELLDLDVIRPMETNPSAYLDLVAGSIQGLLERDFVPPCQRLRSVRRRLSRIPEVLRAARVNLRNPPRISTEIAIRQFQGVLRLYQVGIPAAAAACRDGHLQADLAEAGSNAVRAVQRYLDYLREDLRFRSMGAYALGLDVYRRKLAYAELETTPIDTLLERGWQALDETTRRMETLAERIAPGAGIAAALDLLARDAPAADQLVAFVADRLDTIRSFLRTRDLISMPLGDDLAVRETPGFRRGISLAALEPPGVWERDAIEAYYDVTLPAPERSERERWDLLASFNRFSADLVLIHEVLPGHYYQSLSRVNAPSRLRQLLGAGSTTEGWAHYCEQMMIEEGYGGGDPRFELAQLAMAIRRIGRLIVGISLHAQRMSLSAAEELFRKRCYLAPAHAEREAERCALDPMCLVDALGKWRILELREQVKRHLGADFRLRDFHDAFLRQGIAALPIVRAALLAELEIEVGRVH